MKNKVRHDRFSGPMNLHVDGVKIFDADDRRRKLNDGLEVLREQLELPKIMSLIEKTARWIAPETFNLLPVWFPEHARGKQFFKNGWSEAQTNTSRANGQTVHKREGNRYANLALTYALGLRSDDRPNWSCCHIWGGDDATFQKSNLVVQDHRFYTCLANMLLLPTPLKAFTDAMPEVKAMIRICAQNLYGWHCDHEQATDAVKLIDGWRDWDAFPASWPRSLREKLPIGTMPMNPRIHADAEKRIAQIRRDLAGAGNFYPKRLVQEALQYWRISEVAQP